MKEYKPVVYEEGFSLRHQIKLFKDGFNGVLKNSFSLFVGHLLWTVIIFLLLGSDLFLTKIGFASQGKEFLETKSFMDFLLSWQMFCFIALSYNAQQLFITNNIMKGEGIRKNLFTLFIKQIPLLLKTSLIMGTVLFGSLYLAGSLYIWLFGTQIVGLSELTTLRGLIFVVLSFFLLIWLYFSMLAMPLIYISNNLEPLKQNILAKFRISFFKVLKMFDLIIPTIVGHLFLLFILISITVVSGVKLYEIMQIDVKNEMQNQQLMFMISITMISLLSIAQTFLNKARLKSLTIMFLLTEDQEEYQDRLTEPKVIEKNSNK